MRPQHLRHHREHDRKESIEQVDKTGVYDIRHDLIDGDDPYDPISFDLEGRPSIDSIGSLTRSERLVVNWNAVQTAALYQVKLYQGKSLLDSVLLSDQSEWSPDYFLSPGDYTVSMQAWTGGTGWGVIEEETFAVQAAPAAAASAVKDVSSEAQEDSGLESFSYQPYLPKTPLASDVEAGFAPMALDVSYLLPWGEEAWSAFANNIAHGDNSLSIEYELPEEEYLL